MKLYETLLPGFILVFRTIESLARLQRSRIPSWYRTDGELTPSFGAYSL
jgi:hypothetical protein